jgi:RHS repeat-associated protein
MAIPECQMRLGLRGAGALGVGFPRLDDRRRLRAVKTDRHAPRLRRTAGPLRTRYAGSAWDGRHRVTSRTFPETDQEVFTYDHNGNRLTLTKRDGTTVISFGYDGLNRMATKTFVAANAAADVAYAYDFAGRPTGATFSTVAGTPGVSWTYDSAGRRISEATNGRTLSFTYDAASNPATLTWPDGLSITYGFDPANRLTSVGGTPATVTAGYDGLSRMDALGRASGASTSAIGYDNADRMTTLSHVFTPTTGNEIWGFTFTPASQLATANSTNAAWNWTAASAAAVNTVADGLNRDATVAGVTQTYDKFGNLTSDGTRTFAYDTENRLLTESGPVTLALSYDPMGRLQQSVINGTTTQFLYDGDSLVGEYPATGNTPLRRYVHGAGTDNPLIWYEGGTMTAANANYLITDRQGSIVATAGSSGALAVNYTYDAYGAPNTWGTVGAVPRFRYTGQAAIPEAKLYHYKARVYDPVSGRFLQTDPVGYQDELNLYIYTRGDPIDSVDPTGTLISGVFDPKTQLLWLRDNDSGRMDVARALWRGPRRLAYTICSGASNRSG